MSTTFTVSAGRSLVATTSTAAQFVINVFPTWAGDDNSSADVNGITISYINARDADAAVPAMSTIQDSAILTAINGTLNQETGQVVRPNWTEGTPYPLKVNIPEGVVPNTVYEASIRFELSDGNVVLALVKGRGPIAREALPLMAPLPISSVFPLEKPTVILNKNALSLVVNTSSLPIKALNVSIKPMGEDTSIASRQITKVYFDPSVNSIKYGTVAPDGKLRVDLFQQDFSGTDINLTENDSQEYQIGCTVRGMDDNNYGTGTAMRYFYSPARINQPEILHVKQSDSDVNDYTLDVRFKPPSDLLALERSGIRTVEYIFTDGSGNGHIGGLNNDQSGNFLFDASGNGRRFYYDSETKEYKDASGNVTIAKQIGLRTAAQLLSGGSFDASGAYPITEHAFELLQNNRTINKIGITARGSDLSTSRTAFFDISFNTDSAAGMWLAPKKPVISNPSFDNSGNLTLSVTSFTRTIDVSGNFEVRLVDPSGNQTTDGSFNLFAISADNAKNAEKGYNKERKYNVTIPLTAIPATAAVRGTTLDISFGTPFDIGLKIFDLSGNVSSISEKFTSIKQTLPSTPFFKLRDVNVDGLSAIYCSFDQSNNTIPLPNLGLGSRDASANQTVELDIYTRQSTSVSWPQMPTKQTISKAQYSALTDNDVSGVLLNISALPNGHQVKVVGRIKVPSLTPQGSEFVSYNSREATFSALSLTSLVTDVTIKRKNDARDISANSLVDRSLTFTFNAPTGGADLEKYHLDVFVNDLSGAIYSGSIDASGTPINPTKVKNYSITLNSTTSADDLQRTPSPYNGRAVISFNGATNPGPDSSSDASFNITNDALKFTWGDLVRVKVSSVGRVSDGTRLGAPAVREFVMVPSAPLVLTDVSFNADGSFNDIVTYTIRNNGSTISSLTTMSVFWDAINDSASDLTLAFPDMLSEFNFTNRDVTVGSNFYTRNAGDISGNAWALTYPTLKAANNIIDPNYKVFTGTIGRSGSAGPAVSTLEVKYLTGASKKNPDGSTNPLAGLKAVFSVANGANQLSNNTTSTASFKLTGV
jgi:hypothetical protein